MTTSWLLKEVTYRIGKAGDLLIGLPFDIVLKEVDEVKFPDGDPRNDALRDLRTSLTLARDFGSALLSIMQNSAKTWDKSAEGLGQQVKEPQPS